MSLEPLTSAGWVVQVHAFAALFAFVWGGLQFALPKGTTRHRIMGWTWVVAIAVVAGMSLWIPKFGQVSWIHGLTALVVVLLPLAVVAARRHHIKRHAGAMISLYLGALVIAGVFTLSPGRIMNKVVFGDSAAPAKSESR